LGIDIESESIYGKSSSDYEEGKMCKAIWGTSVLRKRRNHSLPEEPPPRKIRRFRHFSSLELDLSRQFCRRLAVRASPRSGLAGPWNRRSSQCDSLHSSKTKLIASTDKALKPTSSHGATSIKKRKLYQERLQLAILGQFKRGKSTFLNALLGEFLLPTGVIPFTAIPTFIAWGQRRSSVCCWSTVNRMMLRNQLITCALHG
jgi:hypothetical protein